MAMASLAWFLVMVAWKWAAPCAPSAESPSQPSGAMTITAQGVAPSSHLISRVKKHASGVLFISTPTTELQALDLDLLVERKH